MRKRFLSAVLGLLLLLPVFSAAALEEEIGTGEAVLSGYRIPAGTAFTISVDRLQADLGLTLVDLAVSDGAPVDVVGVGPEGEVRFTGEMIDNTVCVPAWADGTGNPFTQAGEWTLKLSFLGYDFYDPEVVFRVEVTASMEVIAGEAAKLEVVRGLEDPSVTQNRAEWTGVALRLTDAFGNPSGGDGGSVTVSLRDGAQGSLSGTAEAPLEDGTAVFSSLALQNEGTQELTGPVLVFTWGEAVLEYTLEGLRLPGKVPEPAAPVPPVFPQNPPAVRPAPAPSAPEVYEPPVEVTKSVKNPDGTTTVRTENRLTGVVRTTCSNGRGVTATVTVTPSGSTELTARITPSAARAAQVHGETVSLPMPALSVRDAQLLAIQTGIGTPVTVEIPVEGANAGTVAVLVGPDGSEKVVKETLTTDHGVTVPVTQDALLKIIDNTRTFSDTDGHWASEAIVFVTARELLSGYGGGAFCPDGVMTRAMVITALARLEGADVSGGEVWYEKSLAWARREGVSDGSAPNEPVTREQLAVMLYNCAGQPAAVCRELGFSDESQISDYARQAVCWAVEQGLLSGMGDGALDPGGTATRAQTAAVLMGFCTSIVR